MTFVLINTCLRYCILGFDLSIISVMCKSYNTKGLYYKTV